MTNFNYDLFKVSKMTDFIYDLFKFSKKTNFNYDLLKVSKTRVPFLWLKTAINFQKWVFACYFFVYNEI